MFKYVFLAGDFFISCQLIADNAPIEPFTDEVL